MISIIVTAYNISKYITKCIDSILNQHCAEWELIIVDDGSTDGTSSICDDYAISDYRIKVIHQNNQGVVQARLNGICESKYNWVIIMDGDDTLKPDAITNIKFLINKNKTRDIIFTNTKHQYKTKKDIISAILNRNLDTPLWGKIYNRNIFNNIITNADFFNNIAIDEDLLMLIACIENANNITLSDISFYNYTKREDSLSHKAISIKSCEKLFANISTLISEYADINDVFFYYRLRFIYNNCISKGVDFSNKEPIIHNLIKESKFFNISGQDKIILRMLHSRILRKIVANRHKNIQPLTEIKISIIMAAYNQEKHITRAIKSVLNQSFRDFELIIVDDFSSDYTRNIIQSFANVDNRVKMICHTQNMGQSVTRLTGLASAKGEYITFMDNDDTINSDSLSKLWDKAKSTNADIVVMGSSRISKLPFIKIPLFIPSRFFHKETYSTNELLDSILIHSGFSVAQWDKLYRKSFLDDITFTPEKYGEDMLFNIQIFSRRGIVTWVDYMGYNWFSGGQSSKSPQLLWEDDKSTYYRCIELIDNNCSSLSKGLITSFIDKIAQAIASPKYKKNDIIHWITEELNNPIWIKVNTTNYPSIENRDADSLYHMGYKHYTSHRLFYTMLNLIF